VGRERANLEPTRRPTPASTRGSTRSYLSGARVLSAGIAATGLLTFAYFSIASHVLGEEEASRLDVLWSVMFVTISVIYRPIEQLLSRSIAEHRARGRHDHHLGGALAIQGLFALAFLVVALLAHDALVGHVFGGSEALYWILVTGTLAYAASYFARGWLAGHERFALYGVLVLLESFSRLCFALAVAIGVASGQTAVALGIAAAPVLSLLVVPAALARAERRARVADDDMAPSTSAPPARAPADGPRSQPTAATPRATSTWQPQAEPPRPAAQPTSGAEAPQYSQPVTIDAVEAALAGPGTEGVHEVSTQNRLMSLRRGGGFAAAVSAIMISEQTLLNVAVLTVAATAADKALAGIVFNVFLIARAPLQLFQAIQTTLLPHLTGLEVREGHEAFHHAVRLTARAIALFAAGVTLVLLAVGPALMEHALFGQQYSYGRVGLAVVGVGMGMHLLSGTLNQAALARARERAAAACWVVAAGAFLVWMLLPLVADQLTRAEVGYLGATTLLALLLAALYRRGGRAAAGVAAGALPVRARTETEREAGAGGRAGSYTLDRT
jgi:O-antigen/teichoic acid export membrane protein